MLGKKPILITAILVMLAAVASTRVMADLSLFDKNFNSINPDMAYAKTEYLTAAGQYDRNADGQIDLIISDRNADGRADYWATDRNFDGKFDDYQYDRNFDGNIDQWEYDLTGNGISDKIYVDADNDQKAELYAILNPITRTYTWYGNMSTAKAAGQMQFQPLPSRKSYRQAYTGGRVGDSF